MSCRSLFIAGAAALAFSLPSAAEAQSYGTVIQDLNLRTGPSTGYRVIAVMPGGAPVAVHQCTGGWCQATYSGRTGWASQRYLDLRVAYAPRPPAPTWRPTPSIGFEFYVGPRPYYYDWRSWQRPNWYSGWHRPHWWNDRPIGWYGPIYWDRSRWWHNGRWHRSPSFAFHIGIG